MKTKKEVEEELQRLKDELLANRQMFAADAYNEDNPETLIDDFAELLEIKANIRLLEHILLNELEQ
jgi:hypothetical protein